MPKNKFSKISSIIQDAKRGKMFILVDDKNKELGIITPQGVINVMASAGSKKVQNKK